MRVLLIEDYAPLRDALVKGLAELGVEIQAAVDGDAAAERLVENSFDVVLLDLMLPGRDGLQILREMRAAGDDTMVMILTARDAVEQRVEGLNAGADDYLVKPFAFDELVARLRALYRRKHAEATPSLRVEELEIDLNGQCARYRGELIDLTAREYALLECLALHRNRVVSREQIWMALYDLEREPSSNVVDVYVGYLRRKLQAAGAPELIQTRRGLGYSLREERA